MPADPLVEIDAVLHAAIREHADVLAQVGGADRVQVFDRAIDVRDDDGAVDWRGRIWIVPERSIADFGWSSSSARLVRRYAIGFGCGALSLARCREIETAILRALRNLFLRQTAGGLPLAESQYPIHDIRVGETRPEREPLDDPQEWQDVCEVEIVCIVPLGSL